MYVSSSCPATKSAEFANKLVLVDGIEQRPIGHGDLGVCPWGICYEKDYENREVKSQSC